MKHLFIQFRFIKRYHQRFNSCTFRVVGTVRYCSKMILLMILLMILSNLRLFSWRSVRFNCQLFHEIILKIFAQTSMLVNSRVTTFLEMFGDSCLQESFCFPYICFSAQIATFEFVYGSIFLEHRDSFFQFRCTER